MARPKARQLTPNAEPESFPRTQDLPTHSPIFWAENKDRLLRQLMIRDIEGLTKRRLCVYFCNPYIETPLSDEDVARLYEIVNADKRAPFDLMLETAGGETDATEGLVSMLREISGDFRVIVPSRAKSNGTMICLAGTEIVMGPPSELGPVEPFLAHVPTSILMTPEYKDIDYVLHRAGIDASRQTKELADRLLRTGMMKRASKKQRSETVQKLCTRDHFHSHGSVINAAEAHALGLKVRSLTGEDPLFSRCWLLNRMYAFDCKLRKIGKIFEGRMNSRSIFGEDPQYGNGDANGSQAIVR